MEVFGAPWYSQCAFTGETFCCHQDCSPLTCHQTVNAVFQLFAPTPSWERQQEVESPLRYSIGFIKSSLASYIVRLRPLNTQCVPFSCASLSASVRTSGIKTGSGDNVSLVGSHSGRRSHCASLYSPLGPGEVHSGISILMFLTFMTIHLFSFPFSSRLFSRYVPAWSRIRLRSLYVWGVHVCFGVKPRRSPCCLSLHMAVGRLLSSSHGVTQFYAWHLVARPCMKVCSLYGC